MTAPRSRTHVRIPDDRMRFYASMDGSDPFPDRAPLDHVPVYPTGRRPARWPVPVLVASILVLGAGALAGCWPW